MFEIIKQFFCIHKSISELRVGHVDYRFCIKCGKRFHKILKTGGN